jgi:hypothetical protein
MVRRGSRKTVDPNDAEKYRQVAASLLNSAGALCLIAGEGDPYGNAIGIISIHAAIAYADALAVAYGGFKSTEGDHRKAVQALQAALTHRAEPGKLRLLEKLLSRKDEISYGGSYYRLADARAMLDHAREFGAWAEEGFALRPR